MPEKLYRYFATERDRLDTLLLHAPSSMGETERALLRTLRSITIDQMQRWSETLANPSAQDSRIAA